MKIIHLSFESGAIGVLVLVVDRGVSDFSEEEGFDSVLFQTFFGIEDKLVDDKLFGQDYISNACTQITRLVKENLI